MLYIKADRPLPAAHASKEKSYLSKDTVRRKNGAGSSESPELSIRFVFTEDLDIVVQKA